MPMKKGGTIMSTITTQDGTQIYYKGPTQRRPAGIPLRVKGITRRDFSSLGGGRMRGGRRLRARE
jgi:hypothetical protein